MKIILRMYVRVCRLEKGHEPLFGGDIVVLRAAHRKEIYKRK
jgi:hypothetical protein